MQRRITDRKANDLAGRLPVSRMGRLHWNTVQGINNRIKVMKLVAYGYRDSAYFFLKIRAAFPDNA
jgi:hypothetical protein